MRNIIIFLLAIALLVAGVCFADGWTHTYGGSYNDFGYSVAQTADGGYIIAGYTESFGAGGSDVYLVKTDGDGDTLWTRTYGGSDDYDGWSVTQTSDGGYIIAGETYSFGAGYSDVYLVKTDGAGDTLWTRTYGGSDYDWGRSVAQTTDGGYIIAGYTGSFGAGYYYDVYLIKTDSDGDTLWTRTYGGSEGDEGYSVAQTTDGGYIIAGLTGSFGAVEGDVYLVKTDGAGDTIWTRTYGGSDEDWGWSVAQTTDGGYIIAGYTYFFGAGDFDVYLVKTDGAGDTLWTHTYGGSDWDYGYFVAQTTDGGYIIAGGTYSFGAGHSDVYLVKTDAAGDTIWTRTYGGSADDYGYSVAQTSDGGYIIAGYTESFGAGSLDVYLIKTDSLGFAGIAERAAQKPRALTITAYPNPFNSSCAITISTPSVSPPYQGGDVPDLSGTIPINRDRGADIAIYDLRGKLVATPFGSANAKPLSPLIRGTDQSASDGQGVYVWQPGKNISSGIYLVKAQMEDGQTATKRIVYLK